MIVSTNNFNNIKGVSKFTFNRWGDGDVSLWLKSHNNWLCQCAYARVKQGDTFIAYGDGCIWKVNNKVYAWLTTGTQQYVIINISSNNYFYEVIGKYSIYDIS